MNRRQAKKKARIKKWEYGLWEWEELQIKNENAERIEVPPMIWEPIGIKKHKIVRGLLDLNTD